MGKMTIMDIAREVGVSKSTVSRALNNSGYVKEEVKARVLEIAEKNLYRGGKLRPVDTGNTNSCRVVAVILPTFKSDFFARIIEGITNIADRNECGVMVFSTNDDVEVELRSVRMLRSLGVKGLIITPVAAYQAIEGWNRLQTELDLLDIPVVLVDRNVKKFKGDSISFDNFNGAYMIGERLVNEGCQRIGAIIGDTCLQLGMDRLYGFEQALKASHNDVYQDFFYTSEGIISVEQAYHYTQKAILQKRMPEAVFLSNTLIATGFFKALFEAHLVPGKDVRCMGFDYVDALDVLDFEYVYLDRQTVKTGEMAMQMLLDHFEREITSRREYLTPARFAK